MLLAAARRLGRLRWRHLRRAAGLGRRFALRTHLASGGRGLRLVRACGALAAALVAAAAWATLNWISKALLLSLRLVFLAADLGLVRPAPSGGAAKCSSRAACTAAAICVFVGFWHLAKAQRWLCGLQLHAGLLLRPRAATARGGRSR